MQQEIENNVAEQLAKRMDSEIIKAVTLYMERHELDFSLYTMHHLLRNMSCYRTPEYTAYTLLGEHILTVFPPKIVRETTYDGTKIHVKQTFEHSHDQT